MTISRLLASVAVALATTAASAQDAIPKLPDYAKTPAELSAVQPTGGAGGSGNAKVQVVTILGDASKPGPYAQLLKVGANAQIAAHHHAGDRVGTVLKGTWHFGYGTQFDKGDVNGDGLIDIALANKKGVNVLLQKPVATKSVVAQ